MPAEIFEKKNDLKHTLNSDDRIYKLIRDDHIQKSGKPEVRNPVRPGRPRLKPIRPRNMSLKIFIK